MLQRNTSHLRNHWRTLLYYAATGLAGLAGIAKAFLYAKILGSEALGYYSLGILIAGYWQYGCQFGLYRGLECVLPATYGAGKVSHAEHLRNRASGTIVVVSAILLCALAVTCIIYSSTNRFFSIVLMLSGVLGSSTLLMGLPLVDLRARSAILQLGLVTGARTLLNLLVGVWAASRFGCIGVLVAEIVVVLFIFALVWRFGCFNFRFELGGFRGLKELFSAGVPVTLQSLLGEVSYNLDRWCIVVFLGTAALGQYAFGMIIFAAGMMIYSAVWSHLGPQASRQYGESQDVTKALQYLNRRVVWISAALIAAWIPLVITVRLIVSRYLPEFAEGGELALLLYWGSAFQILSLYDWIPMTLQKTMPLFWLSILVVILSGTSLGIAAFWHMPLIVYAGIFVAGRAVTAIGQYILANLMREPHYECVA